MSAIGHWQSELPVPPIQRSRASTMTFAIDKNLHWTDHYAEYGFAVVKHAVKDDFIKPAMEEVKRLLGTDLPPRQWTAEAKHSVHKPYDPATMSVLPKVYDQPGL